MRDSGIASTRSHTFSHFLIHYYVMLLLWLTYLFTLYFYFFLSFYFECIYYVIERANGHTFLYIVTPCVIKCDKT